jgi:hypothetical protein
MSLSLLAATVVLGLGALVGIEATTGPEPAPKVALLAPPAAVAPGQAVTLRAHAPSLERRSERPLLTWDTDGDGQFDDGAGTAVAARFAADRLVEVKATWLDGPLPVSRIASATVRVSR